MFSGIPFFSFCQRLVFGLYKKKDIGKFNFYSCLRFFCVELFEKKKKKKIPD